MSLGFWFYIRYLIALPVLLILMIPSVIISLFSKEKALKYSEMIMSKLERMHVWVWDG